MGAGKGFSLSIQGEEASDLSWCPMGSTGGWMPHGEKRGEALKEEHLCCWLLCVRYPLPQLLRLCILLRPT